jgi:hypothetical protein
MLRDSRQSRSVLLSFKFLGTALVGSLTMALVCALAQLSAQIAVLGAFISILGGLFISYIQQQDERERQQNATLEKLAIPLQLAPDHELYEQYQSISRSFTELSDQADPILREIALLKIASVASQVEALAAGSVMFTNTEAWRTVYEKVLKSPDLREYWSVAWVRTKDYWQDQPARQSMDVNYQVVHQGMLIDRIVILHDDLWPTSELLPSLQILPWIQQQHDHGLRIRLVRQSSLSSEPDLLCDFGVYGDRALGVQELDDQSRTLRFVLEFDPQTIRLAKDRWQRLALYTTSFRNLLDQLPDSE